MTKAVVLQACGLTQRECEVLHWLAHGKRDREISAILGIAVRTARKHVEHVRAKLLEQPVLVVAAAHDVIYHPEFQRQTTLATFPQAEVEVLECGHFIPCEEPAALAVLVHRFCRVVADS